jgi:chromosome segregation ATPase
MRASGQYDRRYLPANCVTDRIRSLEDRITAMEHLRHTTQHQQQALGDVGDDMNDLEARLSHLESRMDRKEEFDQHMEDRITRLQSRADHRAESERAAQASMDKRIRELETAMATATRWMQERQPHLQKWETCVGHTLPALQMWVEHHLGTVPTMYATPVVQMVTTVTTVTTMTTPPKALRSRVEYLELQCRSIDDRYDALRARVTESVMEHVGVDKRMNEELADIGKTLGQTAEAEKTQLRATADSEVERIRRELFETFAEYEELYNKLEDSVRADLKQMKSVAAELATTVRTDREQARMEIDDLREKLSTGLTNMSEEALCTSETITAELNSIRASLTLLNAAFEDFTQPAEE